MEQCAALMIDQPEALRGRWLTEHPALWHLHAELGCGKGRFTADTAEALPDTLIVAVEKVPDAMILAMERVQARGLANG